MSSAIPHVSSGIPHVGVQRGNALVARFGAAAVVVATTDADDGPFLPALLAALDGWSDELGSSPAALAWELAALTATHRQSAPAFGAAVRLADGCRVWLRGPVRAVVGWRTVRSTRSSSTVETV